MAATDDSVRRDLLEAAEQHLERDGDLSTRAVCATVGVTQPVLYRLFGDKRGLLDALAERGLERLLARRVESGDEPIAELVAGWDDRLDFARAHPELFRLMFRPSDDAHPAARRAVLAQVRAVVRRCPHRPGTVTLDDAAAAVLAANVGLALACIADPAVYDLDGVRGLLRDAVLASVTGTSAPASPRDRGRAPTVAAAATRLTAHLATREAPLLREEAALMGVWLDRVAQADGDSL